jgi:hypothetical protein
MKKLHEIKPLKSPIKNEGKGTGNVVFVINSLNSTP